MLSKQLEKDDKCSKTPNSTPKYRAFDSISRSPCAATGVITNPNHCKELVGQGEGVEIKIWRVVRIKTSLHQHVVVKKEESVTV